MINNAFYKENDYIEDYLIYKIYLDKIILKKENKYYIWILWGETWKKHFL